MGLIEFAADVFKLREIDDSFVVTENTSLGWVEWAPKGGVLLGLDQLRELRNSGELGKYLIKRQEDGRYLVKSK